MSRFHINPKTGNPGPCKAEKVCPFGDLASDHYDSKEQARAAYETVQAAHADMREVLTRTMEVENLKGVWVDLQGGEKIYGHVIQVTDDAFVIESKSQGAQTERVSDKSGPHAIIPLSAVRRVGMENSARTAYAPGEEKNVMVPASYLSPGLSWMGSIVTKVEKLEETDPRYSASAQLVLHLSNGREQKAAVHHNYALCENDMARRSAVIPPHYFEIAGIPPARRTDFRNQPLTWTSVSDEDAEALASLAAEDHKATAFKPDWKE